jgi:hypothetical protein
MAKFRITVNLIGSREQKSKVIEVPDEELEEFGEDYEKKDYVEENYARDIILEQMVEVGIGWEH